MGSPICRIGDKDIPECLGLPFRAEGSPDVFCNGIPISRQGDKNTPHFGPPHLFVFLPFDRHPICSLHTNPISSGSRTVKVNGRGCGRLGDSVAGCTSVAEGSPNVFAGD